MIDDLILIDDTFLTASEETRREVIKRWNDALRTKECNCPGNTVPFDCPKHGAVENPNWPLLRTTNG